MDLAAAVLTASAEGGIGVVLVVGVGAVAAVSERFQPASKGPLRPDSVRFGRLHATGHPEEIVDEVYLRVRRSADLGVEAVEVSTHGGAATVRSVLALLEEAGASVLAPSDLVERLAAVRQIDRVRLEALEALPRAASLEAAAFLLGAWEGSLSRAIQAAAYDRSEVARLKARAARGLALVSARTAVFVGRPNVGKSSLFNALLGRDRAITSPVPGTTRDLIDGIVIDGGYPLRLVDSAGVTTPKDRVQAEGIARSLRAARDADLRLVVLDGSQSLGDEDRWILEQATADGPTLVVASKADLPDRLGSQARVALRTSAETGEGLDELSRGGLLRAALGLSDPPPGWHEPAPFTRRQVSLLDALETGTPESVTLLLGDASEAPQEDGAGLWP